MRRFYQLYAGLAALHAGDVAERLLTGQTSWLEVARKGLGWFAREA